MAAFLAKERLVARVGLWSGPFDYLPALGRFPPWMEAASATPLDRWYGMVHADEPGESTLIAGWRVLSLNGEPVVLGVGPVPAAHGFIVGRPPAARRRLANRDRQRSARQRGHRFQDSA